MRGDVPQDPLLGECPFCDYLLEGLPVEYICPECGRAFDRRWRVFGHRRRWERLSRRQRTAAVGGLALALIYPVSAFLRWSDVMHWTSYVAIGIALINLTRWLFAVPACFIIVGSNAVAFFDRGKMKLQWYPLDQVTEVEVDFWDRLVLWAGARDLYRIPVRAGRTEAERCAAHINSLIDRDG